MAACWRAISTPWPNEDRLTTSSETLPLSGHQQPSDFRSRVAAERRERMRTRLLDALLDLYTPGERNDGLVIDDVLRAADVARGTFYKYFPSLQAAVEALGERLTTEMIGEYLAIYGQPQNPVVPAIGGLLVVFVRSWHEPRWGSFTSRIDFLSYFERNDAFDLMVRNGLREARAQGLLFFSDMDAAVDLLIGASIEARRRMIRKPHAPRIYIDTIMRHIFNGFAMNSAELDVALEAAWTRLLEQSHIVPWLKNPEIWRTI